MQALVRPSRSHASCRLSRPSRRAQGVLHTLWAAWETFLPFLSKAFHKHLERTLTLSSTSTSKKGRSM